MATVKRRKLNNGTAEARDEGVSLYLDDLAHQARPSHIAWSNQNIVARAGPPTAATLTISLSRLPSKGRQEKPIRLALPRKRPGESTHRLAFSPAGSHLIVVTSLPQTTDASLLTVSNAGLRFAIFEQGLTACWQEWEIAHEWVVGTLAGESPAVVDLQWPAAEPEVYLPQKGSSIYSTIAPQGLRSNDGLSFVAVLDNAELIVCRFGSASSDPIFLRASLSGRSHSTFVAVSPVPPATAALEAIGALAPGLLGANAPATLSSLGLDIGQATAAPASPAMPATTSAVTHAAIGFPSHPSTLLVALQSCPRPTCLPAAAAPMQDQLAQAMAALPADPLPAATAITDTDAANFLADFDMFSGLGSLGALDAEFGDSGPTTVEQMAAEEKSRTARCEPDTTLDGSQPVDSGKVAIWAVAIGWPSSSAAATLTVERLTPMTLVDDERIGEARLTQLGWLSSPEVDSTISLLALVQTSSASYFRTWRVERDRFTLSDAFTALEGKAVQPTQLDETWTFSPQAANLLEDNQVLRVHPHHNASANELRVDLYDKSGGVTKSSAVDLRTLKLASTSSPLPQPLAISATASSPSALLAAGTDAASKPIMAAIDTVAFHDASKLGATLALALRRRSDPTDLLACLSASPAARDIDYARGAVEAAWRDLRVGTAIPAHADRSGSAYKLLRLQYAVYSAVDETSKQSMTSYSLLELAACATSFGHARSRSRTSPAVAYNLGIVWPLIAHAAWYSKFSLGLARALANEDSKDLPFDLLLLLHPLAFAAHKSLVRHMSDFNSFVQNYAAPQEDAAVSVARAVLSDITTGTAPHSVDLSAWTALVASLPTPSPEPVTTTISIAHDALPEEALASLREKARACLPVESSSIKVVIEGKMDEAPVDIITRAKLPAIVPSGVYRRQCTQCQGLSDAPRPPSIWAESSLEANWRLRCWCGGAWGLL